MLTRTIIIVFIVLFFGQINTSSNNIQTKNSFNKGAYFYNNEMYDSAIFYYNKQIEISKNNSQILLENYAGLLDSKIKINDFKSFENDIKWIKNYQQKNKIKYNIVLAKIDIASANFYRLNAKNKEAKHIVENTKKWIFANHKTQDYIYADLLSCEANLEILEDKYTNARLKFKKSISILQQIETQKDTAKIGVRLNNIGTTFLYESNLDSAFFYYTKALQILEKKYRKISPNIAMVKRNIGLIYEYKGLYNNALKYYTEALEIDEKILGNTNMKIAEFCGSIGSVYAAKGDLQKAIDFYKRDELITTKLFGNNHPDLAYSYDNFAAVYLAKNDFKNAEKYLLQSIQLRKKYFKAEQDILLQSYFDLANLYFQNEDIIKSNKYLNILLKNANKKSIVYANTIFLNGKILKLNENFTTSQKQFELALQLYNTIFKSNKNTYIADVYIEISKQNQIAKKLFLADSFANIAMQCCILNKQIILKNTYVNALINKANCKILNTEFQKSIYYLKIALNNINTIRNQYFDNLSKYNINQKANEICAIGVDISHKLYQNTNNKKYIDTAFYFIEAAKSNVLKEKFQYINAIKKLPNKYLKLESTLRSKISILEYKLNNYYKNFEKADVAYLNNLYNKITIEKKNYSKLLQQIEKKYPKYYETKFSNNFASIKNTQNQLKHNQVFINYYIENSILYSICINKTEKNMCVINSNNLKNTTDTFVSNIIQQQQNYQKNGYYLYKQLLPNLKNTSTEIIISADKYLNNLPFDALNFSTATNDFLVKKYAISYTPSATIFTTKNNAINYQNKSIISFLPNYEKQNLNILKFAKNEVLSIQTIAKSTILLDTLANKNNFIRSINTFGCIHFAGHTQTDSTNFLNNSLLFTNNKLSIYEIYNLNSNAQLLCLNACNGNTGTQNNTEGNLNFIHAFSCSGLKNILFSNWNANDQSASIILSQYFKNIISKQTKTIALQNAKINFIKNADATQIHPFYWATFTLFADAYPIKIYTPFYVKFWWIFPFLLLGCVGIYIYKQYK